MSGYKRKILCGGLFALALCLSSDRSFAQNDDLPKIISTPVPAETETEPVDDTFKPTPGVRASRSPVAVTRLLAEKPNYKSGDLLTWEQVKPILDRLRRSRVPVPPEKDLRPRFLSQNDALVKMLGTEKGQSFFKELSKKPSSIDLVDRYRSLPRGDQFLKEMIENTKGGSEFFTNPMWLTQEDALLAEQNGLSNVPNGSKFGEPTGRIYTESQLLEFLAVYKATGKTRAYE